MSKSKVKAAEPADVPFSETDQVTQDADHEVVSSQPLTVVVTADQKAKNEIARFNIQRAWIAARKKEYENLKIAGVDDKAGQKSVHAAWQEIRGKRLLVASKHKEIKADYLQITRAIDGEKNELTTLLEEIENPLKAELDRIETEREEIKMRAENELQARLQTRVTELLEAGMAFNGFLYCIGDTISMDVVTLKGMDDATFMGLKNKVVEVKAAIDQAAADKAAAEQAEKDRLEKQRLELQAKEEALQKREREMQERLDKIEREEARQLLERNQARAKSLEDLGMQFSQSNQVFQFGTFDGGRVAIPIGAVTTPADEDWNRVFKGLTEDILAIKIKQERADADRKELEDKRAQLERRTAERVAELKALGFVFALGNYIKYPKHAGSGLVTMQSETVKTWDAEAWEATKKTAMDQIAATVKADDLQDQKLAEEAEAERLAGMNDSQRIKEYVEKINAALKVPTLKTKKAQMAVAKYNNAVSLLGADLMKY